MSTEEWPERFTAQQKYLKGERSEYHSAFEVLERSFFLLDFYQTCISIFPLPSSTRSPLQLTSTPI
jgi:hypothetical protein